MLSRPDPQVVQTIKNAANTMNRVKRRQFQAQVVLDHCDGNTSLAKTVFGWDQETTRKALHEMETGKIIPDRHRKSRPTFSEKLPNLQNDIRSLVDPNSQTHPTFKNTFRYTRMTARAVLEALVQEKGYQKKKLPAESTMRDLLNKMGYRLRRVQKTKPQKKIPETDAIFANVKSAHAKSDKDDKTLRISIDTKAKIKLGEFSRGGKLRCFEPVKALDHDMEASGILIPFGILEVKQKQFNVVYGNSRETSDFAVDCLEHWWRYRKRHYQHIERLQIDLDNGPELESHRTQFIKRIVDFSDAIQLPIELVYYPPYHSKYNPVEHCWGVLESHWSGALLTDWQAVREWTKSMRWDGIAPNVYVLDREYHTGAKLTAQEMKSYALRLHRNPTIERWSLVIQPS